MERLFAFLMRRLGCQFANGVYELERGEKCA